MKTTKKAMIVTVGTGTRADTDITKPLTKTIRDSNPEFVWLLATRGSHVYAKGIVEKVPLVRGTFDIKLLKDYDNFQSVFQDVNEVFKQLLNMGYRHEDIVVDFTSGTKAMSSGAVLAAVYNQCGSIKYITGKRRHGVVKEGTERFKPIHPDKVFTLQNLRLAARLIEELRFDAAGAILGHIRAPLLEEDQRTIHNSLRAAARGYSAWDLFNHKEALFFLKKLAKRGEEDDRFVPSTSCLEMLVKLAGKENPGDLLLYDLHNNAARRIQEGKYDDAVARLYRTVELLAQITLREKYEIKTGNVNLDLIPEPLVSIVKDHQDQRDGKIKIGLRMAYEVLREKEDPVGQAFVNDRVLQGLLIRRNVSILAHGLEPVSERTARNLIQSIARILKIEFPDFEETARTVQFPWLPAR